MTTTHPALTTSDVLAMANGAWYATEQLSAAASFVSRNWGDHGYRMCPVADGVFAVRSSDGSRFLVLTDRWGNCVECQPEHDFEAKRDALYAMSH